MLFWCRLWRSSWRDWFWWWMQCVLMYNEGRMSTTGSFISNHSDALETNSTQLYFLEIDPCTEFNCNLNLAPLFDINPLQKVLPHWMHVMHDWLGLEWNCSVDRSSETGEYWLRAKVKYLSIFFQASCQRVYCFFQLSEGGLLQHLLSAVREAGVCKNMNQNNSFPVAQHDLMDWTESLHSVSRWLMM